MRDITDEIATKRLPIDQKETEKIEAFNTLFQKNYTLSNYFTNYSNNQYSKQLKQSLVNFAIDLKISLSSNQTHIITLLDGIAIRIQKRINRGILDQSAIYRYINEIHSTQTQDAKNTKDTLSYIRICILLSKHHSSNTIKINWLYYTNKTDSISKLVSNRKIPTVLSMDTLIERFLPTVDIDLSFLYHTENNLYSRMSYEDSHAFKIIQTPKSAQAVQEIARLTGVYFTLNYAASDKLRFFKKLMQFNHEKKGKYPTLNFIKLKIVDFDSLMAFLQQHSSHIAQLCLLWMLPFELLGRNIDQLNHLYYTVVDSSKDYYDLECKFKRAEASSSRIGNSGQIRDSQLFDAHVFIPWKRDVDYRKMNSKSSDPFIMKCQDQNLPYISGLSGMANMFCKILDALLISPNSKMGSDFIQAASAFIVCSGMHSYSEVNESFALYTKLVSPPLIAKSP